MRPQRSLRTSLALIAAASVGLLTACGQSDDSSDGASAAATSQADAGSTSSPTPATSGSSDGGSATTAAATDAGAETAGTESTGTDSAGTSTPEECSTDGSPTELDALDTDVVTVAVDPASASSPLPDLTLRRINCNPGFVNLKNELPADTPVLFWFWAPF